ncbi:MAG: hypothetical protein J6U54_08005 [Clostridiales bacterium]|nr:hypothetical protein [Clostridiales bacterium]
MENNNEIMNNEVMETEATTFEVMDNNCEVRNTEEPVYYPDATNDDSHGPNKLLIAAGIGAALFVAKKAKDKIKPRLEARKQKKEREEKERILAVLKETGLVQEPTEVVKAEETVAATEPKTEEVQTTANPETPATEEKKEG